MRGGRGEVREGQWRCAAPAVGGGGGGGHKIYIFQSGGGGGGKEICIDPIVQYCRAW